MFAINSGQNIPRLKDIHSWWQLDRNGKLVLAFLAAQDRIYPSIADSNAAAIRAPSSCLAEPNFDPLHCPDDRFMDPGNQTLLKISFAHLLHNTEKEKAGLNPRYRPIGLPSHFIRTYCLDQVFVQDFEEVKFGHALTALDYLRDLEYTRRKTLRKAALDLGINQHNWPRVLGASSTASQWVERTQRNGLRIETMYSNLFIDLRIWTMTDTLLSKDFKKAEALAMLNTLFPPAIQDLPNTKINPKILFQQRAIFYSYTIGMEANGPGTMERFKEGISEPNNRHRWPSVRATLERYTDLAEKMIGEAKEAVLMHQSRASETLNFPELGGGLTNVTRFENTRMTPKMSKAKGSFNDMRVRFELSKKPSMAFGEEYSVHSKSMVSVGKHYQQDKRTQSSVDVSGRRPGPSSSTPATSQPMFDNLLSVRSRDLSKPMGFIPPPLNEWEEILGRTFTPRPLDYETESTTSTNLSPRVSFDFDAALGIGYSDSGRSFSSDLQTPCGPKKSKPDVQIDTPSVTKNQQAASPALKSARPLAKYQPPAFTPTAVHPRTADSPNANQKFLKSRASSSRLLSTSGPRPLPPFATLPARRREIVEPYLMPEPLDRPRKPTTPGTSNLSCFPPRNNVRDQSSPAPSSTTKNATSYNQPISTHSAFQDSLEARKMHSNDSATASRPSNSYEGSSRPFKNSWTGSASTTRLPSNNLDFLNFPYTDSSQENNYPNPVIMKKSSFSRFFSRQKSYSALQDDSIQDSLPLGITTECTATRNVTNSRESGERFTASTPRSVKSARFDDSVTTPSTDQDGERPKLKGKKSFNFHRLRSSESHPTLRVARELEEDTEQEIKRKRSYGRGLRPSDSSGPPREWENSYQGPSGLKSVRSRIFGEQPLRGSDSQGALRAEKGVGVLKKLSAAEKERARVEKIRAKEEKRIREREG